MDKLVLPEVIGRVLYELDECNEQPPGVRTIDYQPLQQNSSDLFLNGLSIGLGKERAKGTAKVVGVAVGIPKLVGNCIQEQVAT